MAKDPYKYFRIEARELLEGLTQGALLLEKGSAGKETVARLLRLAHTLKGAARVVKQPAVAELAHGIEDLLAPHREAPAPFPPECVDGVLKLVDGIGSALGVLDAPPPPSPPSEIAEPKPKTNGTHRPPAPTAVRPSRRPSRAPRRVARDKNEGKSAVDESLETVRVDIEQLDLLLSDVSEAVTQIAVLRNGARELDRVRQLATSLLDSLASHRPSDGSQRAQYHHDPLHALADQLRSTVGQLSPVWNSGLDRIEAELREAQDRASHIRLLPASIIFGALERSARDAAHSMGKHVEFVTSGGDVRLDGHVLLAVRDALLHVVRNAIAHGIETEADRLAAGKRASGLVELTVERRGRRVAFSCRDDGRGIDAEAIRRAAVQRGVVSQDDADGMSADAAIDLVFLPGMSTAERVTEISGRGVGLDVVRTTAHRFKGDCDVQTRLGRGTSLMISVPVSLSSVLALLVDVASHVVAIPSDSVVKSVRLQSGELMRASGHHSILVEGESIPFVPLARLIGFGDVRQESERRWTAVIVRAGGKRLALGADRLLGTDDILVKALPKMVGAVPLVAGASLDADGDPQLLLDPHGLVEALGMVGASTAATAKPKRAPILVIDDSLTTRMLEQSILESAGYDVDVATSAEEALSKANDRRYGLFVCDVEMPGMNGFEFVTRTRADASLGKIPAILVTSLNSAADRKKGMDAGASAYIVKSEFDQGGLLKLIRELVG